jgi:alpha-L-fucosidase
MGILPSSWRVFIAAGLLMTLLVPSLHGADGTGQAPYEPTWESVNRHNPGGTAPEWFRDAKFGIYFHWGAYSVPAFGASSFA